MSVFTVSDTRRVNVSSSSTNILAPRRDVDLFSQRFDIKQAKRDRLLNWVEAHDEISRIPSDFTQQMYHLGSALAASALWHSEHASNLLQQVAGTQRNCFNSRRSRQSGIRGRRGLPVSAPSSPLGCEGSKGQLAFLSSGDNNSESGASTTTGGLSSTSSSCASSDETKIANRSFFEGLSRKSFNRLKNQLEDLVLDRGYLTASIQMRCLPLWELHEEYTAGPKIPKIE